MSNEIEKLLFSDLAQIIEHGKQQAVSQVNSALTITYWHVGKKTNEHVLKNERAEYGKKIVVSVARQLAEAFSKSFEIRNLRRMMQFAEEFPNIEIVTSLMTQLSWTHFMQLFSLKTQEQKMFYVYKIAEEKWSVRQTQRY
ncbi:MAG TPA: DUF1016 N-terminal domain-containing protein [Bacteroidales bacterium]|nr:DUF1016 N-terminal domain-containing protein [Bacteroidales bacterium]